MFRLALRQTHSNICMKTYSDDEIKRSIRDFIQSDDEFLAFLNNVTHMSVFKSNYKNILWNLCIFFRLAKFLFMNIRAKDVT
jgi:hypothetical protein